MGDSSLQKRRNMLVHQKWPHTIISNAKAFIPGIYHGLPDKNLSEYLNEYCYHFSRRDFGAKLSDRLAIAMMCEP